MNNTKPQKVVRKLTLSKEKLATVTEKSVRSMGPTVHGPNCTLPHTC